MVIQYLDADPYLPPFEAIVLPEGLYQEADWRHRMEVKTRAMALLKGLDDELDLMSEEIVRSFYFYQSAYTLEFIQNLELQDARSMRMQETNRLRFVMEKNQSEKKPVQKRGKKKDNPWPEYFAIVALHQLYQACQLMEQLFEEKENPTGHNTENLKSDIDYFCLDAMEAVSVAEKLSTVRELKIKEYEKKRKAADASHSQQKEVKKNLIKFYSENHEMYEKKIACVRAFIEILSDKERNLFQASNIERTFTDALRKYLKSTAAGKLEQQL